MSRSRAVILEGSVYPLRTSAFESSGSEAEEINALRAAGCMDRSCQDDDTSASWTLAPFAVALLLE